MVDFIGQKFLLNSEAKPISKWDNEIFDGRPMIYEVVRVEDGVPLFFEDYFERLTNSFLLVNKKLNYSFGFLLHSIYKLLEINNCSSAPVKFLFQYDAPEIFIAHLMEPHVPIDKDYETGVYTVFLHKERQNPNAKVWNQKMRETTISELLLAKAYEGILVDDKGNVTEGSRSNVFFIRKGIVYTTPNDFILSGITRKKVLQVCESIGLEVRYQSIHSTILSSFDAAFLTGTSRKVLPIKAICDFMYSVKNDSMSKIIIEFENLVVDYIDQQRNKSDR